MPKPTHEACLEWAAIAFGWPLLGWTLLIHKVHKTWAIANTTTNQSVGVAAHRTNLTECRHARGRVVVVVEQSVVALHRTLLAARLRMGDEGNRGAVEKVAKDQGGITGGQVTTGQLKGLTGTVCGFAHTGAGVAVEHLRVGGCLRDGGTGGLSCGGSWAGSWRGRPGGG